MLNVSNKFISPRKEICIRITGFLHTERNINSYSGDTLFDHSAIHHKMTHQRSIWTNTPTPPPSLSLSSISFLVHKVTYWKSIVDVPLYLGPWHKVYTISYRTNIRLLYPQTYSNISFYRNLGHVWPKYLLTNNKYKSAENKRHHNNFFRKVRE